MSIVPGKYEHILNINLEVFIMELIHDATISHQIDEAKSLLEVTCGDNSYRLVSTFTDRTIEINFKPGVEFDEHLPDGDVLKSTALIMGNKINILSRKNGQVIGGRVYEFLDNKLFITLTAKSTHLTARRIFKKID